MSNKKVTKNSLADQVCISLRESITSGEFKSGTKLPSENDLAEEFGTSRLTVRLAIQKLNAMGLLETKVGEGSFVKDFNYEDYIDNVSEIIFKPEMMKDIKDFRLGIETSFCILAAKNRTEKELNKLKDLCDEYEEISAAYDVLNDEILTKIAMKDFEIHYYICEMSHNELYKLTYITMKNILVEYIKAIIKFRKSVYNKKKEYSKFSISLKSHNQLFNAIKLQDEKKVKEIITDMVSYEILMKEKYFDE